MAVTAEANSVGAEWSRRSTPVFYLSRRGNPQPVSRRRCRSPTGSPMPSSTRLEALRPVEDPELHRSIVDLGMVRTSRSTAATSTSRSPSPIAGCPLRTEIDNRVTTRRRAPSTASTTSTSTSRSMTDEERAALARAAPRRPGRHRRQPARPRPRRGPGHPVRRPGVSRTRVPAHRVGQGRRRQVVGHHQPRRRARPAGPARSRVVDADVWGFSIPRMLGVDRPPVVIDQMLVPPEATACAASRWASSPRRTSRSSGGARCCTRRSSSSSPTSTGTSPTSSSSTCRPGTGDIAISLAQFLPRAEVYVVTTPQPAAQRVAQRAAFMAQKVNLEVKGVIENMSWFTGDDGTRYELFGAGGGEELAERLEVPAARPGAARARAPRGRRRRPPDRRRRARQRGRRGLRRDRRADRRRAGPDPPVPPRAQDHLTSRGS